jgi:putative transposase
MVMRRVRARIRLTDAERLELKTISRKKSIAHSLVQRATIILLAEEMNNNKNVAENLNISAQKVAQWTHRWEDLKEEGKNIIERLSDAPRSGRSPTITSKQLCQLIALACDNPENYDRPISHWTQPELADEAIKQKIFSSISSRHVGRLLERLELRPHKNQYWLHKKIDELREQKITEICSIYKDAEALKKYRYRNL